MTATKANKEAAEFGWTVYRVRVRRADIQAAIALGYYPDAKPGDWRYSCAPTGADWANLDGGCFRSAADALTSAEEQSNGW